MYRYFLKRLIDIVIGVLVFVFLWPVMLITALAIYIEAPGPVIFRQYRLVKDGKVFKMPSTLAIAFAPLTISLILVIFTAPSSLGAVEVLPSRSAEA